MSSESLTDKGFPVRVTLRETSLSPCSARSELQHSENRAFLRLSRASIGWVEIWTRHSECVEFGSSPISRSNSMSSVKKHSGGPETQSNNKYHKYIRY